MRAAVLLLMAAAAAAAPYNAAVVVYGSTPAGVMAAVRPTKINEEEVQADSMLMMMIL